MGSVPYTYLYGNSRNAEQTATTWAYYLPDALGSVRQLSDSTGQINLAQDYEPYGDVLNSAGTGTSNYGFTGEWTDGTGLVNLRARYLNTGVGRFMTRDIWIGDYNRPLSLNRWSYVEGNPINFTDPIGEIPVTISYVLEHKQDFENNKGFIKSFGLHPTTVAAGIAVQTKDYGYRYAVERFQFFLDQNDCTTGLGPSATNKFNIYGGTCGPNSTDGYLSIIGKASPDLIDDLACYFPEKEELDFFDWDDAIKAMTVRMAASTLWCPNCGAKNQLMIAGMAQNGPGFEWTKSDTTIYSIPKDINQYTNVKDINWYKFFSDRSHSSNDWWLRYRARDYGGDFNLKFQLALFIVNMQALHNKGWKLPPGIRVSDLNDIINIINAKFPPPKND